MADGKRLLDAPSIAVHDRSCGCWDCIKAFVNSVEGAHWRSGAVEYRLAWIRRGGGPEVTQRDDPVYRSERALSQGGRLPSAEELDREYYAGIRHGAHVAASVLSAAEHLADQGDVLALKKWLQQRPDDERRAIAEHLRQRGRT